jgi:hypothetical protein
MTASPKSSTPPSAPEGAATVLHVGETWVACTPTPGYSGNYIGHPDSWEPPEPGDLGQVFLWLEGPKTWVKADIEQAQHLVDGIWEEFNRLLDDSYAEFMAETYEDETSWV